MNTEARVVERLQLAFLLVLSTQMPRGWCVKGGVNLRAFYGSPRASKDIDFDAFGNADRLRDRVAVLLKSASLVSDLRRAQIVLVDSHLSKATDTTVRWQPELVFQGRYGFRTKLEFSMRAATEGDETGGWLLQHQSTSSIDEALRLRHSMAVAPTATHYDVVAACAQKVAALALRSETKARDIFDLNWLLANYPDRCAAAPAPHAEEAAERAAELTVDDFNAQVVPFIDEADAPAFGTSAAWDQMHHRVIDHLLGLGRPIAGG